MFCLFHFLVFGWSSFFPYRWFSTVCAGLTHIDSFRELRDHSSVHHISRQDHTRQRSPPTLAQRSRPRNFLFVSSSSPSLSYFPSLSINVRSTAFLNLPGAPWVHHLPMECIMTFELPDTTLIRYPSRTRSWTCTHPLRAIFGLPSALHINHRRFSIRVPPSLAANTPFRCSDWY